MAKSRSYVVYTCGPSSVLQGPSSACCVVEGLAAFKVQDLARGSSHRGYWHYQLQYLPHLHDRLHTEGWLPAPGTATGGQSLHTD